MVEACPTGSRGRQGGEEVVEAHSDLVQVAEAAVAALMGAAELVLVVEQIGMHLIDHRHE